MTQEELYNKVKALDYFDQLFKDSKDNSVGFWKYFYTDDDEELSDTSSDARSNVCDLLEHEGLEAYDLDNDNDTVWGSIRVKETTNQEIPMNLPIQPVKAESLSYTAVDIELRHMTGKDSVYWLNFIGESIGNRTDSLRSTNVALWLNDLSVHLWDRIRSNPVHNFEVIDENILCARALAIIFTLWSCRIIRAKAYDKRRSVQSRQGMLRKLTSHASILMECMIDEELDPIYFPKQEWDSPFAPEKIQDLK
jgi:hypothetical protein